MPEDADLTKADAPQPLLVPGLAPGFARDPQTFQLTRNGQPPDTMLPGGIPAWQGGFKPGPPDWVRDYLRRQQSPRMLEDKSLPSPDLGDLKEPLDPPPKQADFAGRGDEYLSPLIQAHNSPDPAVSGTSKLISRTMELEGQGPDPHSSAVSGFLAPLWQQLTRGEPETAGKSPDDILRMRDDRSPEGQAFRGRMWYKYYTGTAGELQSAGLPVNDGTLRLTSRLGGPDAIKVMRADPNTPLSAVLSDRVMVANPDLQGLTTGQMVQFTGQQISGQGNPFAHHRAGMDAMSLLNGDYKSGTDASVAALQRDQAAILSEASRAAPGTSERLEMLHEAHEHARELTRLYEQKINSPPEKKPADLFAGWGGIAIALAALAGSRSGQPLTASLNGMAGAMDAINQGNYRDFDDKMKIWDKQSSYALKAVELQNQEIREILEDQRVADAERQANLNTLYHVAGMDQQIALLRQGDKREEISNLYRMMDLKQKMENEQERIREWKANYDRLKDATPADRRYIDMQMAQLKADATPEERSATLLRAIKDTNAAKQRSGGAAGIQQQQVHDDFIAEWQAKPENEGKEVPPEVDIDAWTRAHQATSRPPPATTMFLQQYRQENPNANSSQLSNAMGEFKRIQSLESGFASGVLGRQIVSLNTVADHLLLAREYFEALNNGQIPRANQLANLIAVETGKPEVTNFRAGRDIMADEVVRLLTTTGGTESDRQGMQSRLADFFSPEQGRGVLEVLDRFVGGRFNALEQQYAQGDPERKERFENKLLTQEAKNLYSRVKRQSATPNTGGAPEWSKGSATGPNNEKIYTDGKAWFHADHSPVQ